MVIGLGVAGVVGCMVAVKFVKEAGEAMAARNRERQPWDL
jgi:hypothetical protein